MLTQVFVAGPMDSNQAPVRRPRLSARLFVVFLIALIFLVPPIVAQARPVPNVLDNFTQILIPCSDLCSVETPDARDFDRCGVVAVQALSDIATKTYGYTWTMWWYRFAASVIAWVVSVVLILVAGSLLSKYRFYDLKILLILSVGLAVVVAFLGLRVESFWSSAARDLLGADKELRQLTTLGLIPAENNSGGPNCYLGRVIEDYGKRREKTGTAKALMGYPGVFRRFQSLTDSTSNLRGEIEQRAEDLLEFLQGKNATLAANWQPTTPDEALAQNGHLQGAAEEVMGLLRFKYWLWISEICLSLLGAWGFAIGHSARRRKAHKPRLRPAEQPQA